MPRRADPGCNWPCARSPSSPSSRWRSWLLPVAVGTGSVEGILDLQRHSAATHTCTLAGPERNALETVAAPAVPAPGAKYGFQLAPARGDTPLAHFPSTVTLTVTVALQWLDPGLLRPDSVHARTGLLHNEPCPLEGRRTLRHRLRHARVLLGGASLGACIEGALPRLAL